MENTLCGANAEWLSRPLCCRYALVHFAALPIQAPALVEESRSPLTWALGTLSDGQRELLGAWRCSPMGAPDWRAVFVDLADRGVERIRFVANADAGAARLAFPHVVETRLELVRKDGSNIGYSMFARRLVTTSAQEMEAIQGEVVRIVGQRRGSLVSPSWLFFVGQVLQRVDNQLGSMALCLSGASRIRSRRCNVEPRRCRVPAPINCW
ncbi:hypothetical protein DBR47_06255 [Paucibacter sp. KBW04]|uniref:transposase n=1 Tax=Paucibacter sp. KBW04 TaxID=2153361 RepID=UPI000F566E12|nr:hypothetical protein DBR47_06255 [Paucibacter sp. KBW04]